MTTDKPALIINVNLAGSDRDYDQHVTLLDTGLFVEAVGLDLRDLDPDHLSVLVLRQNARLVQQGSRVEVEAGDGRRGGGRRFCSRT